MLQRMSTEEEVAFWHRLDMKMEEELELGVLPPDIWLEDVGQRVWWGPELELVPEAPALLALGAEQMEVDGGVELVQEDGATVEDDAMVE